MLNVENRIQYMITFNSNVMIRNLFLLVVFLGCVSLRHVEAAIDIVPKDVYKRQITLNDLPPLLFEGRSFPKPNGL